jgi:hypothetical protein
MNEQELKSIWQSYDKKIDKILEINKQQLHAIKIQNAEVSIDSFKRNHAIVMTLGMVWVLFLGFLLYNARNNIYFTVSVGLILLFNVFAVALYLRHIIILSQINIAESITETQRKLALVHTSYSQVGRVLLLQTPLYCTFYYSDALIQHGGTLFWTIQAVVVPTLTVISIYLFKKLSQKNVADNWVNRSDKFFGSEKLQKAISFLNEIEEYKKES